MPRITNTGNAHGQDNIQHGLTMGIDLEGQDLTDNIFILNTKADKHIATTHPPQHHGGHHTFIWQASEDEAREFLDCIFTQFRALAVPALGGGNDIWIEVSFSANDMAHLQVQGGRVPGIARLGVQEIRIGATVWHDDNGYSFLFNHGPLVYQFLSS